MAALTSARPPGDRPLVSVPGLAAALRQPDDWRFASSTADRLQPSKLAHIYRLAPHSATASGLSVEEEAGSAAHVVDQIMDRLRRLAGAYGEWQHFDIGAFFDLFPHQAELLVQVSERVSTVHVVVHADLLLPAFQTAERFWSRRFLPAYQAAGPALREERGGPFAHTFRTEVQPHMVDLWQRTLAVVHATRAILTQDLSFLAASGGEAERYRWRNAWQIAPPSHLDPALLPGLDALPTLTLSATFPLPTSRQPGRVRRLRRRWNQRGATRSGFDTPPTA